MDSSKLKRWLGIAGGLITLISFVGGAYLWGGRIEVRVEVVERDVNQVEELHESDAAQIREDLRRALAISCQAAGISMDRCF